MKISHLQYFRTLARTLSYAEAAESLFISQPGLSYAIAALEDELGFQLFEREGRRIRLTNGGAVYLQAVESALTLLENAALSARNTAVRHQEVLTIGIPGSFMRTTLVSDFARFLQEKEKDSLLHTKVLHGTAALKELRLGRIDAAVSEIPTRETEFECHTLPAYDLVLLVPKNHPLAGEKEVDLKEAAACYPFIKRSENNGSSRYIYAKLKENGIFPHFVGESENTTGVAWFVANGLGLAVTPAIPSLQTMPICQLGFHNFDRRTYRYLIRMRDGMRSRLANEFWRFAMEGSYILHEA